MESNDVVWVWPQLSRAYRIQTVNTEKSPKNDEEEVRAMIHSAILQEKDGIQEKLSGESGSIREYLMRSHLAAREIAASYGFHLHYAKMLNGKPGDHSVPPFPTKERRVAMEASS